MAQLALALFSLDPHQVHNRSSAEFSSVLLPQLATTRSYVNAAAGALGAAYDKCVLHRTHHHDKQLITRLNLSALRQVQEELQQPEPEVVPLLTAAVLLAAAESLQYNQKDALRHLLGAFSIISLRTGSSPDSDSASSRVSTPRNTSNEYLTSMQDIFHTLDYHVSMYAWSRSPQFPPLPVTNEILYPTSIHDLVTGHSALQQWNLHFIAKALGPEWDERIDFPPTLTAQQDYLVAWIKRWLKTYAVLFENPGPQSAGRQTSHFKILKAQTLTMLIATSNVKPPTQVTYDSYASHFEEIINLAESVLFPSVSNGTTGPKRSLLPYSPVPGIIHPLYFTARKYRHSVSRRRAIYLLRHAGIEGPFHGDMEARVAARLVEIEEDHKPFKPVLSPSEVLALGDIPDRRRVYMCWIVEPSSEEGGRLHGDGMMRRVMKFSQRRGRAPEAKFTEVGTSPMSTSNVINAQQLAMDVDAQSDGCDWSDDEQMWDIWDEVVEAAWPAET